MENNSNQVIQPIVPATQTQPVYHPVNNRKRLYVIISGLLVLLVLMGAGAYYLWSQNSNTAQVNQPTDTSPSVSPDAQQTISPNSTNWITYRDINLKYELQYPPNPLMKKGNMSFTVGYFINKGDPDNIQDVQDPEKTYWIKSGFISESQLGLMGVDYCGGTNDPSRCEVITLNGVKSIIDWGIRSEYTKTGSNGKTEIATQLKALVSIPHPTGGMVTIELQPVVPESKETFYKIIKTFKYIK